LSTLTGGVKSDAYSNIAATNNARIQLLATGTVVDRNIADINPALIVNSLLGTGNIQNWQQAGVTVASVNSVGDFRGTGFGNTTSTNNGYFLLGAGSSPTISRNVADTIATLTINNVHASNTGFIASFQSGGTPLVTISKTGLLTIQSANFSIAPAAPAGTYNILGRSTQAGTVGNVITAPTLGTGQLILGSSIVGSGTAIPTQAYVDTVRDRILYGATTVNFNGTDTVFNIAHGMGVTPTSVSITFGDAGQLNFVQSVRTLSSTNITFTCSTAPTAGSQTVYWQVFR
jgi:hypothetical protein